MKINIRKCLFFYKGVKYDKAYKMKRLRLYLRLMSTEGLGERRIKKLIARIERLEDFSREDASEILGRKLAVKIEESLSRKLPYEDKVVESVEKEGIKVFFLEDREYPRKLKAIEDPPPVLFCKGYVPSGGLGVVGTRKPSRISLEAVERIVRERKRNVISGGAKGIDLKAHGEALKQGFKTFVILGSGILNTPSSVKKLCQGYEGRVSLISEFLPFQKATRYTFPKRNRIIAALSDEVFVIEAGKKSGALITANYAIRYGKPVYVFVGDRNSERWKGCLRLIKEGLAKEYKVEERTKEGELIDFLKKPRTYDEIVLFLGLEKAQVMRTLTELMIKGLVKREGAHYVSV